MNANDDDRVVDLLDQPAVVLGYHPASDTVVVALTNVFGLWDEAELIQDELLPELLAAP